MSEYEYLDLEDVLGIIRTMSLGPVKDLGLLDSATARPKSSAFGDDAYPTLSLKAAALLHSMTKNHALIDGNKRIAWLSTVVFCDLNGYSPKISDDEAFQLVWDIASSQQYDVGSIAARLRLEKNE